jgi:uncharacterized protein (DUF4213/DUF364 family)
MLTDEIMDQMLPKAAGHAATDIRIGMGYTAVLLAEGNCGLAYTFHEQEYESRCLIPEAGKLTGRKISELIRWLKLPDTTACAVGLAAINAILAPPPSAVESDILSLLPVNSDDSVGMIGFFGPLVNPLKKWVKALHIFERRPNLESGILPESATRHILPKCQVAVISATAILNQTIDGLLDLCKTAREIAILDPSTPFLPEAFGRHGVTMLSELQVVDPAQILRIVSEGGGTRQFGGAVKKLTLRMNSHQSEKCTTNFMHQSNPGFKNQKLVKFPIYHLIILHSAMFLI